MTSMESGTFEHIMATRIMEVETKSMPRLARRVKARKAELEADYAELELQT